MRIIYGAHAEVARPSLLSFEEGKHVLSEIAWPEEWIGRYVDAHLGRFMVTIDRLVDMPRSARVIENGSKP